MPAAPNKYHHTMEQQQALRQNDHSHHNHIHGHGHGHHHHHPPLPPSSPSHHRPLSSDHDSEVVSRVDRDTNPGTNGTISIKSAAAAAVSAAYDTKDSTTTTTATSHYSKHPTPSPSPSPHASRTEQSTSRSTQPSSSSTMTTSGSVTRSNAAGAGAGPGIGTTSNSTDNGSSAIPPSGVIVRNGPKGKLFQCTGFGDCRMVFTRSEHLARHARKHTGEKPFQCVVEGCTRMFSRFDNMVQHTQTHTKGTRRETSAGIASKIALESRRKSEAGLLGTGRGGGGAGHGRIPRKKRGSMSSTSGSEAGAQSLARKGRVNSMPLLRAGGGATDAKERAHATTGRHGLESRDNCRARKRILPSSSSTASLDLNTGSDATRSPSTVAEASEETSPAMTPTADSAKSPAPARKGSLSSSNPSSNSTTLSWYASKLHHKPSFDIGLSQYDRTLGLDAHLPPWNNRYEYPIDAPGYHHRPRHPLSPERSSHSEEDEDDEDSDDPRQLPSLSTGRRDEWHTRQQPQKSWRGSVDSIDNCTLPPLRPNGLDELDRPPRQHQYNPQPYSRFSGSARLPSISRSGYCSFGAGEDQKSGTHGLHGRYRSNGSDGLDEDDLNDEIDDLESHVKVEIREQDHDQDFGTERYAPKARRLSLVDLERPIQETREALDHSISVQQAKFEGVDVSEDEIQALEAFGELWSQGRDVDMDIDAAAAVVAVVSKKIGGGVAGGGVGELIHPALVVAKMVPVRNEIEPHALGSDRGRRSPRPSHTAERDAATSLEFLRSSEVRAMEVD